MNAAAGAAAAVLASLLACASAGAAAGEAMAPGFDLPGAQGRVQLSAYRGKLVYLDFWASWCGPCKRSFPWMNGLQQRHGGAGLQVLAINLDAKGEDAAAFLSRVPAAFTIAYDPAGATARAYGIKGMPSSALIGRDGKLLWLHSGFNDNDTAALEARIQSALQQP
jgi:thiol-disulfide isomerase/thioredoxin